MQVTTELDVAEKLLLSPELLLVSIAVDIQVDRRRVLEEAFETILAEGQ